MIVSFRINLLLALGWLLLATGPAQAADRYWDSNTISSGAGTNPNGIWGTSQFWNTSSTGGFGTVSNALTTAADTLYFSAGTSATGAYTISVNGVQAAGRIVLEEGTVTFTGGTIALRAASNGGITLQTTAGNAVIQSDVILDYLSSISVASGRMLSMTGIISGAGGLSLSGGGTLVLSGDNTHTGVTTLSNGTLSVSSVSNGGVPGPLGAATSLVLNGGTLRYTGTTASTDRSVTIGSSSTTTIEVVESDTNLTLAGTVTGGTLFKTGAGTLNLAGSNTRTGPTYLNDGTLSISDETNLWTSASGFYARLIFNGGTLKATASFTIDDSNRGIEIASSRIGLFEVGSGLSLTVGRPITGPSASGLIKTSGGTLLLTGANTYNGSTTVRGGTLEVATGGSIPSGSMTVGSSSGDSAALVLGGGSILSYTSTLGQAPSSQGTANVRGGTWTSGGYLTIGDSGTGVLNLSGGSISSGSGGGSILGGNAGSQGTANVSGGTWTWTGGVFIIGSYGTGVLNLSGTGSINSAGGTLGQRAGGQGTANVTGGTWAHSGNLIIGSFGAGVVNLTGGTVDVSGTVTLATNSTGSGTLNFGTGGGMVGTLNAATITGGSGTALVNFNHTGSFTLSQTLTGTLGVNHLGGGKTTLTQTNTYSGGTIISAGELRVSNTTGSATGSGAVTLAAGATLSGSGIINAGANAITLNGNLTIGDDNSAAADLALGTTGGSGIVLGSTGSITFSLFSGAGAGDNTGTLAASDRLVFSGDVTIQPGAKLVIENPTGMAGFSNGDQWRLWDFATVGTRLGTFDEVNIVGPALDGINAWSFDTSTGILSIVPEPGRASLLLIGLIAALLRRRCASTT